MPIFAVISPLEAQNLDSFGMLPPTKEAALLLTYIDSITLQIQYARINSTYPAIPISAVTIGLTGHTIRET